jgi:hypothetical protein
MPCSQNLIVIWVVQNLTGRPHRYQPEYDTSPTGWGLGPGGLGAGGWGIGRMSFESWLLFAEITLFKFIKIYLWVEFYVLLQNFMSKVL